MTRESLTDRVRLLVAEIAGPSRTPAGAGWDTPLWDGGFWLTSAELLEAVLSCEQEFGVNFAGELGGEMLRSVDTLAAAVWAKREA